MLHKYIYTFFLCGKKTHNIKLNHLDFLNVQYSSVKYIDMAVQQTSSLFIFQNWN